MITVGVSEVKSVMREERLRWEVFVTVLLEFVHSCYEADQLLFLNFWPACNLL